MSACFFRDFPSAGLCVGRLRRGHLCPKRVLRQHGHERAVWDDRAWVWMCGGEGHGNTGHHGDFDGLRLRIPANMLPTDFREMMAEIGMEWWIDKHITGPARS
jgi:hypothetical protein